MDAGILIARLILGLAIAAHGAQKLFGWFGGHGRQGNGAGSSRASGFRPGVCLRGLPRAWASSVRRAPDRRRPSRARGPGRSSFW